MRHSLALIEPLMSNGQGRLPIRVCSAGIVELTGLGGHIWEPALIEGAKFSYRLFSGEFGQPSSGSGATRLRIAMQTVKQRWPSADLVEWSGALVTIYTGLEGESWPWSVAMVARVTSYQRDEQVLQLNAAVDTAPFEAIVADEAYAGTTGAEGSLDLKGSNKPLALGRPRNVEPQLVDAVDNVYQFSAYGPIEAVEALFERGSDFGAALGDYADYAALVAANVPEGRWATCLAQGLIRLGAPAFGVVTGDIRGHAVGGVAPRLPGELIAAAADIAGVPSSLIDRASLSALDTAAPYPCSLMLRDSSTVSAVAQSIAQSVNHVSGVGLDGRLAVTPIKISQATPLTLHAQGQEWPLVSAADERSTSPPFAKVQLGAARNWRVQTPDEIASQADLIPRGLYSETNWYREGNIVDSEDGSQWLYVSQTPTDGNAPPTWPTTSNAFWSNLVPPTSVDYASVANAPTSLAELDSAADTKLGGIEEFADVTANSQVTFDPVTTIAIQANQSGVTTTTLPVSRLIRLRRGGVVINTGITVGTLELPGGIAASASVTDGVVTVNVTQADAAGTIIVPVTFAGITYEREVVVTRSVSSGTSGGGTGAASFTDTTMFNLSSTSYVQVSDADAIVAADSNGELNFRFTSSYDGDRAAADVIARYSSDGGTTWNDVAPAAVGSEAQRDAYVFDPGTGEDYEYSQPGYVFYDRTQTGLTPGADYEVALFARRSGGSGTIDWLNSNFTVSQP